MKIICSALAGAMLLMGSCKDDDPTPTRTQLLTSKTWRIVGGTFDGEEVKADPCFSDDEIVFDLSGDLEADFGTEKCYESEPDHKVSSWQFLKNDTEMVWEQDDIVQRIKVLELTSEIFRVELIGPSPKTTYTLKPVL